MNHNDFASSLILTQIKENIFWKDDSSRAWLWRWEGGHAKSRTVVGHCQKKLLIILSHLWSSVMAGTGPRHGRQRAQAWHANTASPASTILTPKLELGNINFWLCRPNCLSRHRHQVWATANYVGPRKKVSALGRMTEQPFWVDINISININIKFEQLSGSKEKKLSAGTWDDRTTVVKETLRSSLANRWWAPF